MAQVLKDEILEDILKAALQEFYEKGYRPAAMREIAGRAKILTGLIYSYYKNKESLLMLSSVQSFMIGRGCSLPRMTAI